MSTASLATSRTTATGGAVSRGERVPVLGERPPLLAGHDRAQASRRIARCGERSPARVYIEECAGRASGRGFQLLRILGIAAPYILWFQPGKYSGRVQVFIRDLPLSIAYRVEGPTGLISKRRGRPSNRRKPEALRTKALTIIRERYWDFGPTLAAEKLREVHRITLGRETLRLWMVEAGIWADRKQQRKQVHQPRRGKRAKRADLDIPTRAFKNVE
jgi:hypothetical protein